MCNDVQFVAQPHGSWKLISKWFLKCPIQFKMIYIKSMNNQNAIERANARIVKEPSSQSVLYALCVEYAIWSVNKK